MVKTMTNKYKYPSTGHVPWSPEMHRDDSYHPDMSFFEDKEVIVTEKMDGENTTIYSDSEYHARSINSSYHESRSYVGKIAGEVGYRLPEGWRICGENMYAKHSIKYENLKSYFYVFSIWDEKNTCLSWDDTVEWCILLDLEHVPVIWQGDYDANEIERINMRHLSNTSKDPVEGYVMRNAHSFHYDDFEMNHVKYVRPNHVQTDEHWRFKQIEPNELK